MSKADRRDAGALPPLVSGAVDTHAHVFLERLGAVPGSRYAPTSDAPLSDYLRHLDANRISSAFLVQPSFLGTDNTFMLSAVASAPARLRAVAVVEPDTDDQALCDLAASGVVGVRLNLIGADTPDLSARPYRGFLNRLRRAGLFLEIHAEGKQWAYLLPHALASAGIVVIDHFGRPSQAERESGDISAILAAFEDRRVYVKFSAPYRFQADARRLAQAFLARGPERILWGSDWPFTQHPHVGAYSTARGWLDQWVSSDAERSAILDGNVRALLADTQSARWAGAVVS